MLLYLLHFSDNLDSEHVKQILKYHPKYISSFFFTRYMYVIFVLIKLSRKLRYYIRLKKNQLTTSYGWPLGTPGPACFHAAGHNILRLFIDKSFLASISGQAGVFLVDCLSFLSKSKKIIKVHALIFSLLYYFPWALWVIQPGNSRKWWGHIRHKKEEGGWRRSNFDRNAVKMRRRLLVFITMMWHSDCQH